VSLRTRKEICYENAEYVNITAKWQRLKPAFQSKEARDIWEPCLREFSQSEAFERGREYRVDFYEGKNARPCWHDGDWRFGHGRRIPEWWDYACGKACHWIVDLALFVAQSKLKSEEWRIVSSQKHSTVWNGDCENPLLFDINFLALGVPAKEALSLAATGRELKVGKYLKAYLHQGVLCH